MDTAGVLLACLLASVESLQQTPPASVEVMQEAGQEAPEVEEPEAPDVEVPAAEQEQAEAAVEEAGQEVEEAGQEVEPAVGEAAVEAEPTIPALPPVEESRPLVVHGWFSLNYRLRSTDDEDDQDLVSVLGVDVGDPTRDRITFHFLGRASADLDGDRDEEGYYVFDSIEDTFDSAINGRLYHAYADIHRTGVFELARIGRQSLDETPELFYLDGVRLQTEPLGEYQLVLGGYGGASTHLYESSNDDDWLAGGHASIRPWSSSRLRFDFTHVEDDRDGRSFDNDLVGLSMWQNLGSMAQLFGRFTWLETDARDLLVRGTCGFVEQGLHVQASYFQQFETLEMLALEFDPYFSSAATYHPYMQWRVQATQAVGDHLDISLGGDYRYLEDDVDEGAYNREFARVYANPVLHDVLMEGLSIGATVDYWATDGGEDIQTFGADVTVPLVEELEATAGTEYSLYKYDAFADRERDHVRTYFVGLDYRWKDVRLRADYAYEDDEFDEYHTLKAGLTWTF